MTGVNTSSASRRTRDIVASRLILHFWWFVVAVLLSTILLQYVNNPHDTVAQHAERLRWTMGSFVLVAFVIAPILIWDSIRLSRKLAAPVEQVEERLHDFAREGKALEIPEETDSLWRGLVCECNAALRSANGLRVDTGSEGKSSVPSPSSPKSSRTRRLRHEA